MNVAPPRLTANDRAAIRLFSRQWVKFPPCWNPTAFLRQAARNGVIEIAGQDGAWRIRLTERGDRLRNCQGEA